MTCTLSRNLLQRSRLAERLPIDFAPGPVETPLARMECDASESCEWRITLGRADRHDGRPPNAPGAANSSPLFPGQRYGYSAGFENTPSAPPSRGNPVAFASALDDFDPLFVQISWGMDAATPNRLLAHWPMQGASIVVNGSFVEVFAGTFLVPDDPSSISQDGAPTLMAQITPSNGLGVSDAAELSIQQPEVIQVGYAAATDPAVVYVPEFARRVRVVGVDAVTGRVPDFGHPRIIGEWFGDDTGIVDGFAQGSAIGCCPTWQTVPARATLLRIGSPGPSVECMEPPFTSLIALVHWRIAP